MRQLLEMVSWWLYHAWPSPARQLYDHHRCLTRRLVGKFRPVETVTWQAQDSTWQLLEMVSWWLYHAWPSLGRQLYDHRHCLTRVLVGKFQLVEIVTWQAQDLTHQIWNVSYSPIHHSHTHNDYWIPDNNLVGDNGN